MLVKSGVNVAIRDLQLHPNLFFMSTMPGSSQVLLTGLLYIHQRSSSPLPKVPLLDAIFSSSKGFFHLRPKSSSAPNELKIKIIISLMITTLKLLMILFVIKNMSEDPSDFKQH